MCCLVICNLNPLYLCKFINPCAACCNHVKDNQHAIYCDSYNRWIHLKCTSLTRNDYSLLSSDTSDWFYHLCLQSISPFNHFDNGVNYLNSVFVFSRDDRPYSTLLRSTDSFNIVDEHFNVDMDIDADNNFVSNTGHDVRYFTSSEFNSNISKSHTWQDPQINLFVIHINSRSIDKNFGEIQQLLDSLLIKFNVIALSETWAFNQYIPGYVCYSKSRCDKRGGVVAIYVNSLLCSSIDT